MDSNDPTTGGHHASSDDRSTMKWQHRGHHNNQGNSYHKRGNFSSQSQFSGQRFGPQSFERGRGRGRGRGQGGSDRGQYSGRGQRGNDRGQRGNDRGQRGNDRGQRGNGRGQRGSDRGHRRNGRGQRGSDRGYGGRGRGHGGIDDYVNEGDVTGRGRKRCRIRPPSTVVKSDFYCCSCERGFRLKEQLDEHNSEHIVCGLDGCQFEAHALVVTKHIQIQHTGNLYERMKNLNTPEGLNKWREERRSNFPTFEKIQHKVDAAKEKRERREIFGMRNEKLVYRSVSPNTFRYKIKTFVDQRLSFADMQRNLRRIDYEQGDKWRFREFTYFRDGQRRRGPFFEMNRSPIVSLESFYLDTKLGKGEKLKKQRKVRWKGFKVKDQECLTDSESECEGGAIPISDEEDDYKQESENGKLKNQRDSEMEVSSSIPTPAISAGFSLVDYSSASENEEEINQTASNIKSSTDGHPSSPNSVKTSVFDIFSNTAKSSERDTPSPAGSDKSHLSDAESNSGARNLSFSIEEVSRRPSRKLRSIVRTTGRGGRHGRRSQFRAQLLEKLLQDPIRKERNILLQTCRYLRENNFFMDDKSKFSTQTNDAQVKLPEMESRRMEIDSTDGSTTNNQESSNDHSVIVASE